MPDRHVFDWAASLGGVPNTGGLLEQSLLMSLYSTLAYRVLLQPEIRSIGRIKLIPSRSLQDRARAGASLGDFQRSYVTSRLFAEGNERVAELEVVSTRLLVALVVRAHEFDVVAIRGTMDFHDALTDLNDRSFAVEPGAKAIRFHEGFYLAAAEASAGLNRLLRRRGARGVHMTGHSLGGAVAAIYRADDRLLPDTAIQSCFTFGMPRYGNGRAVQERPTPHHVRFERSVDWVPTVPRRRPYEDSRPLGLITVNGGGRGRRCKHAGLQVNRGLVGRLARSFRTPGHFVEHYVSALQCLADDPCHDDLGWALVP